MTADTATIDCPVKCEGCSVVVPMAGALHTEDPVYLCGKCAAGAVESQMRDERDAEKARADAAERMVAELREKARAYLGSADLGGVHERADLIAALASTAEVAGRWVPAGVAAGIAKRCDAAIAARDEAVANLRDRCIDSVDSVANMKRADAAERARDEAIAEAAQWREALTEIVRELDDEDGCMGIDCEPLDPKETSAQRLVTAVVRRVADLQSWTRRYVMGDRMMGDATSEEEAARSRVATLVADRDAALIARDEVGIQLAAAQAEIARMRPVVEAVRFARAGGLCQSAAVDCTLRALDAVPGDALAPVAKEDEHVVVALADLNTGRWHKLRVFHVLDEAQAYFDELMAELQAAPQPGVFVKINGTLAPVVPPSPAGASAPASGSTPGASSATASSSAAAANPSAPRGTCESPTTAHLCEVDAILRAGRTPVYVRTLSDLAIVRACLKQRDYEVHDYGTALSAGGVFFGCADASVTIVGGDR